MHWKMTSGKLRTLLLPKGKYVAEFANKFFKYITEHKNDIDNMAIDLLCSYNLLISHNGVTQMLNHHQFSSPLILLFAVIE